MIYIVNSQGLKLKMSVAKYKATAKRVKQQAKSLIGSNVRVRTSKNTANWSSAEWFSDILSEV
jgi:predicted transcriptional regulator